MPIHRYPFVSNVMHWTASDVGRRNCAAGFTAYTARENKDVNSSKILCIRNNNSISLNVTEGVKGYSGDYADSP